MVGGAKSHGNLEIRDAWVVLETHRARETRFQVRGSWDMMKPRVEKNLVVRGSEQEDSDSAEAIGQWRLKIRGSSIRVSLTEAPGLNPDQDPITCN